MEESNQFKFIPLEVVEALNYNPDTGETSCSIGSIKLRENRMLYEHPEFGAFSITRVAWKKQTGEDPGLSVVDHGDTNPFNNKWANLRLATREQNAQNRSINKNSTSGVKGVTWDKRAGKWRARIQKGGKLLYSEYFTELEEAAQKISIKRKELHGEFARDY